MPERMRRKCSGGFELDFYLLHRVKDDYATVELWRTGREGGLVRFHHDACTLDLEGELDGWDKILRMYWRIKLPANLKIGQHSSDENEVEDLAARIHGALCLMREQNVILGEMQSSPMPDAKCELTLKEFRTWMEARRFKVKIDPIEGDVKIKRPGFPLFRPKRSREETLALGKWVAMAFHALNPKEANETVLYISEGANFQTTWVRIEW